MKCMKGPDCRDRSNPSPALLVYEHWRDETGNPRAECIRCALHVLTSDREDFAGMQISVTGGALMALVKLTAAASSEATRQLGGGNGRPQSGGGGSKQCRQCGKPIDAKYAYCRDCKQKQPDCPCGRGKLGWSSRDNAYYARCWHCQQDEKAGVGGGSESSEDLPW